MKKVFLSMATVALLFTACNNDSNDNSFENEESASFEKGEKQCFTMDKLSENLILDTTLESKMMAIEEQTKNYSKKQTKNGIYQKLVNGKIEIPVVFHVIYRTNNENVPLSILEDQIATLNEDFNMQNPNRGDMPAEFASVEVNVDINFVIEDVIRVQNSKKRSWRPNDSMKFSSQGGSDVVNPQEFLNIWIVNYMPYRGGQILGYAQFPGGDWTTDGVVLSDGFVGEDQSTATHEVGHYLNLRHIWGDGGCGASDFVTDTPDANSYTRGCPGYPVSECGSNNMTMNFMDYTDDPCTYMFTLGQKVRMDAVFAPNGFRATMGD